MQEPVKLFDVSTVFEQEIHKMVKQEVDKAVKPIQKKYKDYVEKVQEEVNDSIRNGLKIRLIKEEKELGTVKGFKHKQFNLLLQTIHAGQNVLMVGSAGTGKSHAVEQVAEALKLKFYSISVSPQTTKSDIFGYGNVTGEFVKTPFYEAYANGGLFLMDEIDAGNASVLVAINSALSNGVTSFPIIGNVRRHKDFVMVGTANTFGFGADRQYVGRNQLDAATLDRFSIIHWLVDTQLEKNLAGNTEMDKKWFDFIQDVRKYVDEVGTRVIISPRATIRGRDLRSVGLNNSEVLDIALLNSLPKDLHSVIKDKAKSFGVS